MSQQAVRTDPQNIMKIIIDHMSCMCLNSFEYMIVLAPVDIFLVL